MCILIQKPAHVDFHETWLADFYARNRDGAGIMYPDHGTVTVQKIVSPSVTEWIDFYNRHARKRACLIHLRMRTHGAINYGNVHPYPIGKTGIFLMHNGVLHTGNKANPLRSDTWHYIETRLRKPLEKNPRLMHDRKFQEQHARFIGPTNKFALLGPDGHPVVLNRKSGVKWAGAWFSNTYAWDAEAAEGLTRA